jgi:hypothetical protein
MAHFFQLQGRMDEVSSQYFDMTQKASDVRGHETRAAKRIQGEWRASKVRYIFASVMKGARTLQRAVRGWLGRQRAMAIRLQQNRKLNLHFFQHCATVIQRYFRGWWSRRVLLDFHARKQYLDTVAKRGEWTTEYLTREQQKKLADAKAAEERDMRSEFDNLAGELHHLVSTKTIAGVYNPPYNDALPRAFGKPIEQHLRDSCKVQMVKSLRRPRHRIAIAESPRMGGIATTDSHTNQQKVAGRTGGGPPQELPDREAYKSRSASVGKMQKIQGPFRAKEQIELTNAKAYKNYGSIQAAAPYDAVEHDRKMQQRLSKLTRTSPVDFQYPGNPGTKPPPSSVHTNVPFRERPVELRSDCVELPKIRDKPPFFTALPQDKHFSEYHDHHLIASGHA